MCKETRHSPGWRRGTRLGALDTGAYLLARARLRDGYRCTIHWENLPGFIEAFPNIDVPSELYGFDRNRFSCGGGTAALTIVFHVERRDSQRCSHHRLTGGRSPVPDDSG